MYYVQYTINSNELITHCNSTQTVLTHKCCIVQGVPYYWAHFVFCNFSGSGAPTEGLFTIFQQPWKFATL